MARISKRQVVAGLVVTLGVADGVGIYVAQHKLDKPRDVSPRELAVASEPLAEPIAIRTNGELRSAVALAGSAVAPHAQPEQSAPQTARLALAEPVGVQAAVAAPVSPLAVSRAARQTAPVETGRMASAEKPAVRRAGSRHSTELAGTEQRLDLRVHQQRIPARLTHAERGPFQEDAFDAAFNNAPDEARLPDPAYGGPDPQPRGQASAELPPLELSTSQIHSEPSGTSDADAPPAPPATAAGAEDTLPKS